MINNVSISCHYLLVVIRPLRDLGSHFLISSLHCLGDLPALLLCISIARRKSAVIPAIVSSLEYLFPVMYPENLRMILQHCVINSVDLVISAQRQVEILLMGPDPLQDLTIAPLLIIVQQIKIIFLVSLVCGLHLLFLQRTHLHRITHSPLPGHYRTGSKKSHHKHRQKQTKHRKMTFLHFVYPFSQLS